MNGDYFAYVSQQETGPSYVCLYDFDRCSGQIHFIDTVSAKSGTNEFYGLVSVFGGRVASNSHISVKKSSLAGGITSATAMEMASLGGYNAAAGWSLYDYLFISTLTAATCGLLSQVIPGIRRQNEEQELLSKFDDDSNSGVVHSVDSLSESELVENERNLR